ncbi:MAG: YvcK family protein [Chloroflexi bacterium]|nr:YvcK family protein [Chloroflexota bacterium]
MKIASLTLYFNSGIVNAVRLKLNGQGLRDRPGNRWRHFLRWLEPGLGIKRWLLLAIFGTALIGLGLAIFLLDIYRANPGSPWLVLLSLSAFPRWLRALLFGSSGGILLVVSWIKLSRTLLAPYVKPGKPVVDAVSRYRRKERGPHIVAIGGGTGLSTLLRGLKKYSSNIVAIVTMADDGGSSGRLRRSLGIPPPGDLRNCLAALSDDEDLLTQLFQYRFLEGELAGHSFGNLFIAALAGAMGSFEQGLIEAGRVLGVSGRVLPATLSDVILVAEKSFAVDSQSVRVKGESNIPSFPGRIRMLQLEPNNPPAYPEALNALLNADMVIVGPGSLYTSVLPNLLVPDIIAAIKSSRGFKVFVSNIATQTGETDGYNCRQHYEAITQHIGDGIFDTVVANDFFEAHLDEKIAWVKPPVKGFMTPLYTTDLIDESRPSHHDSRKLSEALIALLEERTGPLDLTALDNLEHIERPQ